jgi:uncharacterized surface protein with fasciclin (FAS1) repeats
MHIGSKYLAIALAVAVPLAGCSDADGPTEGSAPTTSTATLASTLAESDELSTLAQALTTTGLASVFDGPGAYTVLAPSDAAFAELPESVVASDEQRAVIVALLRNHIVPGQLDAASIAEAIAAKQGPVEMRTLGGGTVSFAMDGDALTVSAGEERATVDKAGEVIASNGVVLPIDGLLAEPPVPEQGGGETVAAQ